MNSSHNRKKRIADLPLSDRPREKLVVKGTENLTDAELLAILLRTGTPRQNVLQLAQTLLRLFPLQKLPTVSIDQLTKTPGIGKVKAIELAAMLELGKRIFGTETLTNITIANTHDTLAQVKDIADKKQEYLIVLYLNARHELMQKEVVGIGSLNAAILEPKDIFHHALIRPCAEIIMIHNHPSGNPDPSDADIQFTKRIHEAGQLMGITLIDHLIVAKTKYFSFAETESYS